MRRLLQLGIENEGEFIGRAEAGGALNRADHDRPGIFHEFLERRIRLLRVIDVADRLGMAVRAQSGNFVESQFGAGGDDQIVIGFAAAVIELDAIFRRMHAPGALFEIADAFAGHHVAQD